MPNVIKVKTFTNSRFQRRPKSRQKKGPKTPLNVIKGTLQNAALPANVSPSMTFAGSAAFCSVGTEAGKGGRRAPGVVAGRHNGDSGGEIIVVLVVNFFAV